MSSNKEKANLIKSQLISNDKIDDTKVKCKKDDRNEWSYDSDTYLVRIEVPEIPIKETDSYYSKNPSLEKPTDDYIQDIKNTVKNIKKTCKRVARYNQSMFEEKAVDTVDGKTTYFTIIVS